MAGGDAVSTVRTACVAGDGEGARPESDVRQRHTHSIGRRFGLGGSGSPGGSWRSENIQTDRNCRKRTIGQRVESNETSAILLPILLIFRRIPKLDVAGSTPVARSLNLVLRRWL